MPTTTNKGYSVPTTGTETNMWGDEINDNSFAVIDKNVGGTVSKTLGASTVNLTASESQNLIVRLTGTLTADVLVTTLANGVQIVENATSGSFAVTFQRNGVGSAVTIPQGSSAVIMLGATQGAREAASSAAEFASGTRMLFQQTAAPTGWTKEASATYNDAALRFVTGTVTTSGSLAFATAMASRAITGAVGNTALTIAQMPAHGHPARISSGGSDFVNTTGGLGLSTSSPSDRAAFTGTLSNTPGEQIGAEGGGGTHNHSLSVNDLNMAVKYADVIIAQKD